MWSIYFVFDGKEEGGRIDGDTEIILPDTEEIVMVAGVRMSS